MNRNPLTDADLDRLVDRTRANLIQQNAGLPIALRMLITADDRVCEQAMAGLVGCSLKTLRNMRAIGDGPPWEKPRGKVTYNLRHFLEWQYSSHGKKIRPEVPETARKFPIVE